MKRSHRLIVSLSCLLTGLLVMASASVALGASFDWRKYEGTTLRVLAATQPGANFIADKLSEFEELTGIRVVWEMLPEAQQRQKLQIEMTSALGDVDVYNSHTGQQGIQFLRAGWYEPLEPYVSNPELTDPDWDLNDWHDNALTEIGRVDHTLVGIPQYVISFLLYYRKDLFEEAGLQAPETFTDFEAAAKKFVDRRGGFYGITMRGMPSPAENPWATLYHNNGGRWFDDNGDPAIDSPEAIETFSLYGRLLREYGPPGPLNINWPQAQDLWLQGKVAMFLDTSAFVTNFENPEQSTIVGKVGYATAPRGEGKEVKPPLNGWNLSISPFSREKEAAWYFIQWATSKEMAARAQAVGIQQGRQSAWESLDFVEGLGAKHPDLVMAMQEAYQHGKNHLYPPWVPVAKARDLVGEAIAAAIQNKDVRGAAQESKEQLKELEAIR